ncbi:MAG TPA: hypothetical protein VN672_09600 [Solirubrobacteraceae bacterium]|nr:hypothetical protein [Solirubrobacteraceae bacterium]
MLAYLFWHRAAAGVDRAAYEQALERFHRSLAHRPPSGFRGSTSFRVPDLPWLASGEAGDGDGDPPRQAAGYEDWYLLDDWGAIGVLEAAAISRGHLTAHDRVAALAGAATGSVYRLIEGRARLDGAVLAVWISRSPGHEHPSLSVLLGDGMEPDQGGLWRRCLGLGPAPEFCLLAEDAEGVGPPAGVAPTRLPAGWSASVSAREMLGNWSD